MNFFQTLLTDFWEFTEFCNPRLSERVGTTTQPGSTAEVLRAAAKIGAWIIHLQYISCIPDANPDEKGWGTGWQFTRYCAGAQGIWVERKTGKRFTNEMGSSVDRTNAVFDALRREHDLIAIADARAVRHPRSGIFTEEDVKTLVARGYVTEFETLESLADELEMPLESLRQEIAAYSQSVLKGDPYDRMGRRIEKGAEPMGEAPWYAAPLTAKVLSCSGGIAIDLRARVLSVEDDQPIPHLYAAGEITGGLHGALASRIKCYQTSHNAQNRRNKNDALFDWSHCPTLRRIAEHYQTLGRERRYSDRRPHLRRASKIQGACSPVIGNGRAKDCRLRPRFLARPEVGLAAAG